ncbi:YggT family protein [Suttonella sp. R2A3]|uniref:YggT family protein n=1 Tax=Suttonella sp. R2A3 TaxID=2908648 RepID=UPI001F1819F2|nr:YggT family protein [Suttonella sp. R2A3]UJF25035.1 YggT family protein [Suttonella sp. R2A3]
MMHLIGFIIQLAIAVFIIRFHANAYYLGDNPVVAKLNEFTNPLVLPFQRLIPSKRFDIASLIPALIIAVLAAFITARVAYHALIIGVNIFLLGTWLQVVFYAMLIVVIGSWLQADSRQPVMQIALACCEWLLAPIRQIIPSLGGLDFSPIAALFAIQFARQGLNWLTSQLLF